MHDRHPRVVVIGPGALGCLLAALLSRTTPVQLIGRPPTVRAIRRAGGIRVAGLRRGLYPLPAAERPVQVRGAVVLVTVKAYDLVSALAPLRSTLASARCVVVLQNGLAIRATAERVLRRSVVRGVTSLAASLEGPGRVQFNGAGPTLFAADRALAALWRASGLPARTVDDLAPCVWQKLAVNAVVNPVTALLNVPNGALAEFGELSSAVVGEVVAVARREGIGLRTPDVLGALRATVRQTAPNISSMLQDLRAGRHTEIEWITGQLVARATQHGVAVPHNRVLLELVRGLEVARGLR